MMKKRDTGAVAKAWRIFNKHPKSPAEALAAAKRAGVNQHTPATQYQRWLHASAAQRKAKVDGSGSKKKDEKVASEAAARS
jgi:hypothetical protein